jgi:N-glycosidase YbiA
MDIVIPDIPADGRILFFARDRAAFHFMSHFHPAPIALDGLVWPTVEHYYQAHKSEDPTYRRAVHAAKSASHAKRLAASPTAPRRVSFQSWFRLHDAVPRPDWDVVKVDVMRAADWAKYSQHADLGRLLLATGDAELVEDARRDPFWGTGPDDAGLNMAGRVLMEVRQRLKDARA